MRIGDALERLLSPQERSEEGEAESISGGGAFEAEMAAAAARERARRIPRAEDHAAAIVLDPRLVLNLSRPAELEPNGATSLRFQSAAARDSAVEATREDTLEVESPRTERDERASQADDAIERDGDRASEARDSGSESGTRVTEEETSASSASAGSEDETSTAVAEHGENDAPVQAGVAEDSSGAAGASPNAAAQRMASFSMGDGAGVPSRTARAIGVADTDAHAQAPSIATALEASGSETGEGSSGAFDDGENSARGEAFAARLEPSGAGVAIGGASGAAGAASFEAMLRGAMHTAGASSASPLLSGSSPHESLAMEVDAPPTDRDAILSLLSDRVAGALRAGQRELTVRLTPPHLGTLRLRFAFEERGVSARVEVSDPAVHRALEAGLADLRGALHKHDVDLRDLSFAAADRSESERENDQSWNDTRNAKDRDTHEERVASISTTSTGRRSIARSTGLDITA